MRADWGRGGRTNQATGVRKTTNNPRLAEMVKRFEDEYDSTDDDDNQSSGSVELSAEIEAFLEEVRGGDSEDGPTSGGI